MTIGAETHSGTDPAAICGRFESAGFPELKIIDMVCLRSPGEILRLQRFH
jgi:hypothetical protein